MQSIVQQRGAVNFPSFNGDRIHMLTIDRDKPLPEVAKRWQQTIDDMLHGIDHDGPVYLMVDQKRVEAGDVSHLDLSHMHEIQLQAGIAYAGNVTFVHESLPVLHDCERTVVRINVPGHIIH